MQLKSAVIVFCLASQWSAAATATVAASTTVRIPVRGESFTLEGFLYTPDGAGKHPLVIFNHGSSGGDPKRESPAAEVATFFTARGYGVLVPMRRGRGTSGGVSMESEEKNCDPGSWRAGLDSAYEDVTSAIDYASTLPSIESSKLLLAGESRGGFLAVAYAAEGERRSQIGAVINFVGGWVAQAEDRCPKDFNEIAFRRYGSASPIPELWLYGDHDAFYTTPSILRYARAYRRGGGRVIFELVRHVPHNGHWLVGYPNLWGAQVDRYLQSE